MRKLAAAEILVFVATLVATHGSLADEPTNLASVTVNGTWTSTTTSYSFGWYSGGYLNVGAPPPSLGLYPGYISATNYRALNCAKAYATWGPGANSGAKPGFTMYILGNHGWHDVSTGTYYQTAPNNPNPPTPNSIEIGGVTYTSQTMIFLPGAGNGNFGYLIRAIAHEWAHQWGAQDLHDHSWNDAYEAGDRAMNNYMQDKGSKCGGL
ncbi:hypothetical protein ACFPME_12110 [Rhodanobacter umsongensis]|uniref:Peptidase n=1 Tax=Rhodanobacter umsongensis TaxID=633153 RepID=A0ABW0JNI9_9GAMM